MPQQPASRTSSSNPGTGAKGALGVCGERQGLVMAVTVEQRLATGPKSQTPSSARSATRPARDATPRPPRRRARHRGAAAANRRGSSTAARFDEEQLVARAHLLVQRPDRTARRGARLVDLPSESAVRPQQPASSGVSPRPARRRSLAKASPTCGSWYCTKQSTNSVALPRRASRVVAAQWTAREGRQRALMRDPKDDRLRGAPAPSFRLR